MRIVKIASVSIITCLSISLMNVAYSLEPMNLWQTNSCKVDGVSMSDVNLLDGAPKTVNCVWDYGSAGIQLRLHAGQTPLISAQCEFKRAENSVDVLGSVEGKNAASIKNLDLTSDTIRFTIQNTLSDKDLDIQFLLNSGMNYKDKFSRLVHWETDENINYQPGDSISCTFTPLSLIK